MCPFCLGTVVMVTAGAASTGVLGLVLARVVRGKAAMDDAGQELYSRKEEWRRGNGDERD